MDRQHRDVNAKFGAGRRMNSIEWKQHKAEMQRQLQQDTIDIFKDPYFKENHLGTFDCTLCNTVHRDQANYLVHAVGKRHRNRLLLRNLQEKEKKQQEEERQLKLAKRKGLIVDGVKVRKSETNIGKPGYVVNQVKDEGIVSFKFEIPYPDHEEGFIPQHRIMSTYEIKRKERENTDNPQQQKKEDNRYQYLVIACYPYKTIAFKIPRALIEKKTESWGPSPESGIPTFTLQIYFTEEEINSYLERYPNE